MRLRGIRIGTSSGALAALGLDVHDGRSVVGGVTLEAVPTADTGLLALDLAGAPADGPLPLADVPTGTADGPHPSGAIAVDHVVVRCGDVAGTIAALGTEPRRLHDRDGRRYGFLVAGPALLEFVGPVDPTDRPARLWGLALAVADLDDAVDLLGGACGRPRPAVQPGRRIATVRHEALGLPVPTVLLSPRRS